MIISDQSQATVTAWVLSDIYTQASLVTDFFGS